MNWNWKIINGILHFKPCTLRKVHVVENVLKLCRLMYELLFISGTKVINVISMAYQILWIKYAY